MIPKDKYMRKWILLAGLVGILLGAILFGIADRLLTEPSDVAGEVIQPTVTSRILEEEDQASEPVVVPEATSQTSKSSPVPNEGSQDSKSSTAANEGVQAALPSASPPVNAQGPVPCPITTADIQTSALNLAPQADVQAQVEAGWPMAGANPQRTSWTAETLPGELRTAWVKPIVPYVSQHVQVVGAAGKVYVSSAAGLYAFDADRGDVAWVYPTELPLGHSPTYSNGVLYVGGMDRQMHAVSADNGEGLWTYTAEGGFSTNPVVANGMVYAGNRDGAFYAINISDGSLAWKYQTCNQILQSPAYQDGTLYFASNDGYAYALNAQNGVLVWRSADRLPSMGFYSWWPVIYQDYVIFTRASFGSGKNGEESDYLFCPDPVPPATRPAGCAIANDWMPGELGLEPGSWVSGTATMNVNNNPHGITFADYFERFPHYRNAIFYDRTSGEEVAFDIDHDGITDAAPVTWAGDAGTPSPPIVSGFDNVLYFRSLTRGSGGFGSKTIAGWKVGTSIMSLPYSNTAGQSGYWPGDEPLGMSAAGNKIYWNLCCDRYVGAVDISQPNTDFLSNTSIKGSGRQWSYTSSSGLPFFSWPDNIGIPDFYFQEAVKFFWDPIPNSDPPGLPAIFWNENDKVGPSVYQGKLYVILGNALVAFSPAGVGEAAPILPSAEIVTGRTGSTLTSEYLQARLEQEVQEMVTAGHLQPSFIDAGFITGFHSRVFEDSLGHYWHNPADVQRILLRALPHLSTDLQTQLKAYLQGELALFSPALYAHTGFTGGMQRDPYPYPPAENVFRSFTIPGVEPQAISTFSGWGLPPQNVYALWKYALAGLGDAQTLLNQLGSRFNAPITANRNSTDATVLSDDYLRAFPHVHNAYIAGYIGYIELAKMAGQTTAQYAAYEDELERLYVLRIENLMTFPNPQEPWMCENECYFESLITYYNFAYMTPELADYLATNARSSNPDQDILSILQKYQDIAPYWMVAHNGETQGESAIQPYQQTHSLFQALAMVKNAPREELVKYLDTPIIPVGDLYYIDNLVSVLEAP
jgi:PQQ-like domain